MTRYRSERVPGDADLSDAFAVRRDVFIDEQGVSEAEEMDGRDEEAVHFVLHDTRKEVAVGTARLRTPRPETAKVERVAVREAYRQEGLGVELMELIEAEAREQGCTNAVLHAQRRVIPFYEELGYEITSEEFEEAGIPHVEMEKSL
jgi:predicted GNAT family N-acyltransferase